jgi:hypothetical protein
MPLMSLHSLIENYTHWYTTQGFFFYETILGSNNDSYDHSFHNNSKKENPIAYFAHHTSGDRGYDISLNVSAHQLMLLNKKGVTEDVIQTYHKNWYTQFCTLTSQNNILHFKYTKSEETQRVSLYIKILQTQKNNDFEYTISDDPVNALTKFAQLYIS